MSNPEKKVPVISKDTIALPGKSKGFRVAWNPAGTRFAVTTNESQILVFDAKAQRLIQTLPVPATGSLHGAVAYSPDGRYLAGGNGIIVLFDAETGKTLRGIAGPYEKNPHGAQGIDTLAFSPDSKTIATHYHYLVTEKGERVDNLSAYRVDTGEPVFSIRTSAGDITTDLAFSPDGKYLLVGRRDLVTYDRQKSTGERFQYFTFVDYMEPQTGKIVKSISPVHVMRPTALAVSQDGRFIATGTNTLTREGNRNPKSGEWEEILNKDPIRLWNFSSGQLIREFGPIEGSVRSLTMSPDGRYLASCQSWDIMLWDMGSGQLIQKIETPDKWKLSGIFQCAFSPDSKYLAAPVADQIYLIRIQ